MNKVNERASNIANKIASGERNFATLTENELARALVAAEDRERDNNQSTALMYLDAPPMLRDMMDGYFVTQGGVKKAVGGDLQAAANAETAKEVVDEFTLCSREGVKAIDGLCPVHGGDNCLKRYSTVKAEQHIKSRL